MVKISAYIIAYNEAEKIEAAINSVKWADEIVVADSYSNDGTTEIAESMGARVVQIPFKGFGDLRNQAMAACTHDWIFSLDSDEQCTPEAQQEIREVVRSENPQDAYYVPRKNFVMGRWMKYSGYYPDYRQPQLFKKGVLRFTLEPVHESFEILSSKIGYLKKPIWQFPFKDFEQIMHKADRYSSLGAVKLDQEGKSSGMAKAFFRGLWAFFFTYFIKAGILDGWAGFVISFYNFESTFYKYAKLHELKSDWSAPRSAGEDA